MRVEGVPHTEGSYKWRVTRLQLESLAAAADAAAAAKHALAGRSGSGPSRYQPRSGACARSLSARHVCAFGCCCAAGDAYGCVLPLQLAASPASAPCPPARPTEEERNRLREEAAGKKYNAMAPPVAAYTSEVALASVETALGGSAAQVSLPVMCSAWPHAATAASPPVLHSS